MTKLYLYNTLSRKKEEFEPLNAPQVGMYVCGPTVYGDPHLGHARPAITFDLLFRYLTFLGYKVRYVRNITDVGHLLNDADEGRDKIAEKAKQDCLEPMEVAQYYTNRYRQAMAQLNVLPPSIEPLASGHIIEQIALVERIMDRGYAYEREGSVYFDIARYCEWFKYGQLSGRVLDELKCNTRELDGQENKKHPFDFALWKKAAPEHIMRWSSPWSEGFPGWHLECSAMSRKYLGNQFDIHGGGMDLLFPHHECEMAQNSAANIPSAKYWVHNNMITINEQKMGKSLGNFITLEALFGGEHSLLEQPYSPMTIRFFILQAHYRSTLDFSNAALQASEKGLARLMKACGTLDTLKPAPVSSVDIDALENDCFAALNDDLNSPIAISILFDGVRTINAVSEGKASLSQTDIDRLKKLYSTVLFDILGLEQESREDSQLTGKLIDCLLDLRQQAKANKDFAASDKIRDALLSLGITVKDTKEGAVWEIG